LFIGYEQAVLPEREKAMAPIRWRLVLEGTESLQALEWVREKLQSHTTEYVPCSKPDNLFRLTRLVVVTPKHEDGDAMLHGPEDDMTERRYTGLNYCCGNVIPDCMLKSASLDGMRHCISWWTLPKTMQDEIAYTRKLGLIYIDRCVMYHPG
jgi:hypothetical protein